MSWTKCQILTTFAAIDAITHILETFNIEGIEIKELNKSKINRSSVADDVRLIFYLPNEDVTLEVLNKIQKKLAKLENYHINIGSAHLSTERISNDWMTAWEKNYQPIKISERLMVVPTWEKMPHQNDDSIIIELDPGLAFGTGSHASTILSLQALEKYVDKGQTIIDVGSGSGILSIAALLLGAKDVLAIDQDKQAVKSSQKNASLNGVDHLLTVQQGNLLADVTRQVDLIVANIIAEVILLLIDDAYKRLKLNGYFIISGIIERKQSLVRESLQKASFEVVETIERDGWLCIIAQK